MVTSVTSNVLQMAKTRAQVSGQTILVVPNSVGGFDLIEESRCCRCLDVVTVVRPGEEPIEVEIDASEKSGKMFLLWLGIFLVAYILGMAAILLNKL